MQIASDATFESSDDVPRTRNPSNTSNSPNDNNNSNNNQNNSNTSNNNNNNGSSSRSGSGSRHNHGNITSNNSNNNNNKSNNDRSGSGSRHEPVFDEDVESRRKSPRITTPSSERTDPMSLPSINNFEALSPGMRPSPSDIAVGIGLYFKFCHRQPIWCFERAEIGDWAAIPQELACSIMVLVSRYSERRDQLLAYGRNVKSLIMLRIANGTVHLTTIESLCLLAYSSFIDGNVDVGQFYLGLAFQLCRSAMLDLSHVYINDDPGSERKKRLFWSLQLLEQSYGRQTGLLSVPTDIWKPQYPPGGSHSRDRMEMEARAPPPLPRDDLGCSQPSEPGVWNTSVNLGWVWSQVRKYVSDCSHNVLKEPWRHDSVYAKVLSDFMETENRIPICHRYDSVKFYERTVDEVRANTDYWAPWLKEQFTYHAIHTVLNHPFLYIVGSQHNPNLAIPNTFWRRSSELALLHATWIVRMIDMVVDKQMCLVDPFFGHVAAIAATVHLYYCCAASARLRNKSNADFQKCRLFLKDFTPHSAACVALEYNLHQMARIAAGHENMDVEDWMPSKIYLSVPLMWKILKFNFTSDLLEDPTARLLHPSLRPTAVAHEDASEGSILEIVVATSPEITINLASGGQEAPTLSHKAPAQTSLGSGRRGGVGGSGPSTSHTSIAEPSWMTNYDDASVAQTDDALTLNTTPWLYADSSQFTNLGGMGFQYAQQQGQGDSGGSAWWEGDNFSNIIFNTF